MTVAALVHRFNAQRSNYITHKVIIILSPADPKAIMPHRISGPGRCLVSEKCIPAAATMVGVRKRCADKSVPLYQVHNWESAMVRESALHPVLILSIIPGNEAVVGNDIAGKWPLKYHGIIQVVGRIIVEQTCRGAIGGVKTIPGI